MIPLARLPWRLIAIVGVVLAIWGIGNLGGRQAVENRVELEAAKDATRDQAASAATNAGVAAEADAFGRAVVRIEREANNATREIERRSATPAAAGHVAGDARVDPDLARIAVCSVSRLRDELVDGCDPASD